MTELISTWPHFFTATILNWNHLLKEDKYKLIVTDSLRFLVHANRIKVFGFVVMINHIHVIWQMKPAISEESVRRDFLKFTAQKIKADLRHSNPELLKSFFVGTRDRTYQFWKRNSLSVELTSQKFFLQKLRYIHENPIRCGICALPEEYYFSSAMFYQTGIDNWGFLSHFNE